MKIFPSSSIKKLDAYTIEHEPIASIDLMERAAQALTKAITERWDITTPVTVFAGPGNNGGDALAVARMLAEKEYKVEAYLFNPKGELSADCQTNKELVEMMDNVKFSEVSTQFVPPALTMDHLVVDGLFGSGLNKPLSGGFAAVVKYINASPATVVAIDIPSGLMGEENTFNVKANIIRAQLTLSLQLPKLAFLFAENSEFVGEWKLLDINLSREAIEETESNYALLEAEEIHALIKPRNTFSHKGNFGHALLIAGSYGMAGASILAARACMRSGVGLLTVHAPIRNNDIRDNRVGGSIISSQKVGPSIADDIKTSAIWSVLFALVAIGLYILLRFRNVAYSVGATVALAVDTILIIGAYSLCYGWVPFSLEIDQTFIGAVLTAIGYSINDKVVIFDRIREFFGLYPKRNRMQLFNDSLNTTLARTINTSLSTLIVLLCIFVLGGDSIRSFAFAMILGVVIGTLSSIFIAAPIAYLTMGNKMPEETKA